nr:ABC transporter permease [Rhizobium sp. Q54]
MHSHRTMPIWMTLPALLFYLALLAVPLLSIFLLSFETEAGPGLDSYRQVFSDPYFLTIFLRTLGLSLLVTGIALVLGTGEALVLSRMSPSWQGIFLVVILGPLLISVIVRTLGWAILFGGNGPLSLVAQWLHLSNGPISLMYSMTGLITALVHVSVPFVVISVWVSLQGINPDVERAGASLGANGFTIFRRLVLPRILPGILSASLVVFSLAATAFATPAIIGGRRLKVVATAIYDEFLSMLNWPLGAALAVVLLLVNVGLFSLFNRVLNRSRRPATTSLSRSEGQST